MDSVLGKNYNPSVGLYNSDRLCRRIILAVSALMHALGEACQAREKLKRPLLEEVLPLLSEVSEAREAPHTSKSCVFIARKTDGVRFVVSVDDSHMQHFSHKGFWHLSGLLTKPTVLTNAVASGCEIEAVRDGVLVEQTPERVVD